MKYDLETLLTDVKAVLTSHLTAKITEINNEKNDSIVLSDIASDAYVLQSLNGATMNFDPFIFYGVSDFATVPNLSYSSQQAEIFVLLVMMDRAEELDIATRMFRYLRCLEEVFQDNFDSANGGVKLSLKSLAPTNLQLANADQRHRIVGVLLSADMG